MFSVRYGEYTIYGYIAFSAIIEAVIILREIYYLSMAIASRDNGFSIVYTATKNFKHDNARAISKQQA